LDRIIRFRAAVDRYTRRGAGQTALPAADTVICRCEHATRADIDRALEQGVQDMASLKMRTRVSMGDCQGRLCVGYCSDRLREATGRTDVGWLRPRFPIDPIPFSAFQNDDSEAVSHDQAL
jgi:hydrogen cyanide synthase HcnB